MPRKGQGKQEMQEKRSYMLRESSKATQVRVHQRHFARTEADIRNTIYRQEKLVLLEVVAGIKLGTKPDRCLERHPRKMQMT